MAIERTKHAWTPTWIGMSVDELCIHCGAKRSSDYSSGQLHYDTSLDPIYCGAPIVIPGETFPYA